MATTRRKPSVTKKDVEKFVGSIVDSVAPSTDYTLELIIGNTVTTSTAPTALEALKNLERPQKIITKGLLVVHHNGKTKELFMMPVQMKRMFYPLAQVTNAKMLAMNI